MAFNSWPNKTKEKGKLERQGNIYFPQTREINEQQNKKYLVKVGREIKDNILYMRILSDSFTNEARITHKVGPLVGVPSTS